MTPPLHRQSDFFDLASPSGRRWSALSVSTQRLALHGPPTSPSPSPSSLFATWSQLFTSNKVDTSLRSSLHQLRLLTSSPKAIDQHSQPRLRPQTSARAPSSLHTRHCLPPPSSHPTPFTAAPKRPPCPVCLSSHARPLSLQLFNLIIINEKPLASSQVRAQNPLEYKC